MEEDMMELQHGLQYDMTPRRMRDYQIDWDKLNYNGYYKSHDFYASKFTGDYSHIPGFDKIIEEMAKNGKTLCEEWNERQQFSNDKVEEVNDNEGGPNTDISEFKDSGQVSQ